MNTVAICALIVLEAVGMWLYFSEKPSRRPSAWRWMLVCPVVFALWSIEIAGEKAEKLSHKISRWVTPGGAA